MHEFVEVSVFNAALAAISRFDEDNDHYDHHELDVMHEPEQ